MLLHSVPFCSCSCVRCSFVQRSACQKTYVEKLWRELFSDPSLWWDNRAEKVNPRYPDFKHKKTQQSLWLIDKSNPPWVEAELAAMPPGTLQFGIFSWNIRLDKYVKAEKFEQAMELFLQMKQEGMNPDKFSYIPVLTACAKLRDLQQGKDIHTQIIQNGLGSDVCVGSCLIDMYAKCGAIVDARGVFNKMRIRDVVSWNTMIGGYVKCGQGRNALDLYRQMNSEMVEPSSITFLALLNACASTLAIEDGRWIHEQIIQSGYETDVFVATSLIDMYSKCGSLGDAERVFHNMCTSNVVFWTAMISGYVRCGEGHKALDLSRQMCRKGIEPNPVTFVGILNACASVAALEEGRRVHQQIITRGFESNIFVGSCLVDMYAKCGCIEDAWRVFSKMPVRNVVAWTAIILGYVKCGDAWKALELLQVMQEEGVNPDPFTFAAVLSACASIGALEEGRRIHKQIIHSGCEVNVFVASSLVDMYAKCGSIEDAQKAFNRLPNHDVVAWNAMIAGYGTHGHAEKAVAHFEQMCEKAVQVNGTTFICLLTACSHGGLLNEGLHYFESMSSAYTISPTVEHYACVVDLLSRADHLHEAEDLIETMPCESTVSLWRSLLGACRVHGNLEVGERVAKRVLELDPESAAGYVMLSNIYAAAGVWDSSEKMHQERLRRCEDVNG